MKAIAPIRKTVRRLWLLIPALTAALLLVGCSGNNQKPASSTGPKVPG